MSVVKLNFLPLLCCLLLPALNINAQDEPAIRSAGAILLTGNEDPATSKVYIVQLRSPSAAEYYASFEKKTRASHLNSKSSIPRFEKNSAAIKTYAARLDEEQQRVLSASGRGTRKLYSYKYGLNGFAARMSVADAQKLEGHPEVLNVWEDEVRPMATSHSSLFLGLFDIDGGLRSEHALDGDGVVIGIIDSGIAPEHPALLESRGADRPGACQSTWSETTLLGRWLCKKYTKLPDVLDFEEPEDWDGEVRNRR